MRVEVQVDWGRVAGKPRQDDHLNDLVPPRSRAERQLWYVAVAREIEARVDTGEFQSYADAARRCGVSRARIASIRDPVFVCNPICYARNKLSEHL